MFWHIFLIIFIIFYYSLFSRIDCYTSFKIEKQLIHLCFSFSFFVAMEIIEAVKALNLTYLANLLEKSNILNEFQQNSSFTLFAPTNAAFDVLPSDIKNKMSDPKVLEKILKYHMINKTVWTYEFGRDKFIHSSNGLRLRLNSFRFGKVKYLRASSSFTDVCAFSRLFEH